MTGDVTLFICISCKTEDGGAVRAGRALFDAVSAGLISGAVGNVDVKPVDCLAVCKRPCTVTLSGEGKWTYVVGDLDPVAHAGDVIAAALSYGATANGIIPWKQRPQCFRKGIVARIPPLGFQPEEPA